MTMYRRGSAGRARVRAVACGVAAATLLASGVSAKPAKAGGTSDLTVLAAPYTGARDTSNCDDGGGTAACVANGAGTVAGAGAADSSLGPKALAATGGRAIGSAGVYRRHTIRTAATAVRYRFVFEGISAGARTSADGLADLGARAQVGAYVTHSSCPACAVTVHHTVVDADPLSSLPAEIRSQSFAVDVEVRNPAGKVPAGTLSPEALFVSDVSPYGSREIPFASDGSAEISGSIARIEVRVLR